MRDLYSDVEVVHLLDCQDITADTWTKYVDLFGYEAAVISVNVGAATPLSGSNYFTPVLYEADAAPTASGSYSAAAAGDIRGAFTAIDAQADDQATQSVGYIGDARYLAVKLDETGTVTSFLVSVDAILGVPRHAPAGTTVVTTGAIT